MSEGMLQLSENGVILLITILIAITMNVVFVIMKKNNITLTRLIGNNPNMKKTIDAIIVMVRESVVEISSTVREKNIDGVITKEEMEEIKVEALKVINSKLKKSQIILIRSIEKDAQKWISDLIDDQLNKKI